jgi:uncharacterized protein (UPF0248 family)
MQPLREFLSRIRWDTEFGKGTFTVGYVDRIAHRERIVAFTSITVDPGGRSFSVCNDTGVTVRIPFHRVRTVYKDGLPVWRRRPRDAQSAETQREPN